jgi:hypothetical protein
VLKQLALINKVLLEKLLVDQLIPPPLIAVFTGAYRNASLELRKGHRI